MTKEGRMDVSKKGRDYYAVLQVHRKASPEVIRAARNALIKGKHPDQTGSEAVLREIQEAYEVLHDSARRTEYDRTETDPDGQIIGAFRVLERIAKGGYGRTYKGEHILTGLPVCIKDCRWLDSDVQKVLLEETNLLWDLRHHALPAIRDVVRTDDGRYYLVMSYIPGKNIFDLVRDSGKMDPEDVTSVAERALNGLMYLHHHGVLHGDIKPQNIILGAGREATLVDFGLSQSRPDADSRATGYTEYFSPPEQVNQSGPLLPESDFYSLGMTMIFALSGSLDCVKRKEIPSRVPDALTEFIGKLIVRDVLARPNWKKMNLFEEIRRVRQAAFGRTHSGMRPIPGLN